MFLLGVVSLRHLGWRRGPGDLAGPGLRPRPHTDTLLGFWLGKRTVDRVHETVFVILVEIGLVVAGQLFLFGIA